MVNGELLLPSSEGGGRAVNLTGSPDAYGVAIWSATEGVHFDGRYTVDPSTGTWSTSPDPLPPGDYEVVGGAPGNLAYANSDPVQLTVNADGTFSLPVQPRLKTATVSGVVYAPDDGDASTPRVPVTRGYVLLNETGATGADFSGIASNGVWTFAPAAGDYSVTANPQDGTHLASAPVSVTAPRTGIEITVERGKVLGTVVPPAGWTPPQDWGGIWSSVWITRAVTNEWVGHAEVADGRFATNLDPGDYVLKPQAPHENHEGWAAGTATITVGDAGTVTVLNGDAVTQADPRFDSAGRFTVALQNPNVVGTVVGPAGEALDFGTWIEIERLGGEYPEHAGGESTDEDGTFRMLLADGSYRLTAHEPWNNPNGWTRASVDITIQGGQVTVPEGALEIRLRAANVRGRVLTPQGDPVAYSWIQINKSDGSPVDAFAGTNELGDYSLRLEEAGTYTLRANTGWNDTSGLAPGSVNVTLTVPDGGTEPVLTHINGQAVASPADPVDITLQPPNVRGVVTEPGTTTAVPGAHVEAKRWNGEFYDWFDGGWTYADDGTFSYKLENGQYQLEVRPPWGSSNGWAARSVEIVVADAGVTLLGGAALPDPWNVELRSANLVGEIRNPDGSAAVPHANVEVRKADSWEHVAWVEASESGRWATFLPDGSYDVTSRPPWNNSNGYVQSTARIALTTVGDATTVTVESGGTVSAGLLVTQLRGSNVNGTVYAPDDNDAGTADVPIQDAWINVTDASGRWVDAWASTGQNGTFGLSLDAGTYTITAQPGWNNTAGYTAASTQVTVDPADGDETVVIRLGTPNVSGLVTGTGGTGIVDAYVDVRNADTGEWYPGTNTRSGGAFGLSLEDGTWELTAHPPWNNTGGYVATRKTVTVSSGTLQGSADIPMQGANVTGTIVGGGQPATNVGIGVRNNDTGAWVDAWAWTGSTGAFSLYLPTGSYRLTANPGWGSSGNFGNAVVDVTVNSLNAVSSVTAESGSAALNQDGSVQITLPGANLTGKVFQPDGVTGVRDAFVYATTVEGWWVDNGWTQSDEDGDYSLTLPPGTYTVHAQPPWWTDQAWSKNKVENVVVPTSDAVPNTVTAHVSLRTPNVSGKLLPPGDSTAGVPHASVEIFNLDPNIWSHVDVWTQTRSNGDFGVELPEGSYYVTIRPPWHNPDGWAQTAFTVDVAASGTPTFGTPAASDGTVRLNGPTVTGTISAPGVATVADVWITAERQTGGVDTADTTDDTWEWYDWASSRSNGQYGIYVPSAKYGNFRFTAHPPWGGTGGWVRTISPVTAVNGATTVNIQLTTGNVKGTVKDPSGTNTIQDSWLSVEKQTNDGGTPSDYTDGTWTWYDAWANSKSNGSFALNLPEDGTYRVTAHPSWYNPNSYVAGTNTVVVSGNGATATWTNEAVVRLSNGNISGTVKRSDGVTAVQGAMLDIRFDTSSANESGALTSNEQSVDASATTDSSGRFSLNLPNGNYLVRALAPVGSGITSGAFVELTVDGTETWPLQLGS